MMRRSPLLLILALLLASATTAQPERFAREGNDYVSRCLLTATRLHSQGNTESALESVQKALEGDPQHLEALSMWAELSLAIGKKDEALYAMHSWLSVVEASKKPPVSRKELKSFRTKLLSLDPEANAYRDLLDDHISSLSKIAKDHRKRGRLHAAILLYEEILHADPTHLAAKKAILDIRRTGSSDVATEDVFAGTDPTAGVDSEWIAEQDALKTEWDKAWEKKGENYSYKTNAGFLVMQTASIAMEQMNRAYRKFFHYKEDGAATPRVTVHIFKSRDEYLKLGIGPPVEWSGGHFTGSHVETYIGGVTGKESIRSMYGTLFHEAAHQFVSLTGKGGVPGWLNEAYASFFEGTTILSNGQVRWNEVATHRLFPLVKRIEQGWMATPSEGVRDEKGEWATPTKAPTLRILIENEYQWGPPWYAPTWGVVYFLYNYRDPETGVPVFRERLHDYYLSGAGGRGLSQRVSHFEEVVLKGNKLSPVQSIDELNSIWGDWLLQLRDVQLGKSEATKAGLDHGASALARGDLQLAEELLEEAYLHSPEDPNVLWTLARALEEQKKLDRAASLYRQFVTELELRGLAAEDSRYPLAVERMEELDPLARRHRKVREQTGEQGVALARSYFERGLPLMALEISRRLSTNFSSQEALDLYAEIATASRVSLARWRRAFNDYDLSGWSGADGYYPYGHQIKAEIEPDPTVEKAKSEFLTRELVYESAFDGDYSLEAEMRFGDKANLMGLCFGRKDDQNTHAVVLHPKGFLEVVTKHGSQWDVLAHQQAALSREWHKLRIDVVGRFLDVYLDGQYMLQTQMPSRDALRGAFGLMTGTGQAAYREIRLLARDPHDPAARLERQLARKRLAEDASLRAPGIFSGFQPPEIQVETPFVQGEDFLLADIQGRPVVLIFWTPYQEEHIPTAAYYASLFEKWAPMGFEFLVLVDSSHKREQVEQALEKTPMPGLCVAIDRPEATYPAYHVIAGGWQLPRIVILDVDGHAYWEGDPNLSLGVGWSPGMQTPVDRPLEQIAAKRHLAELLALRGTYRKANALYSEGNYREALLVLAPLADLDAAYSPSVQKVRRMRERILSLGADLPRQSEIALAEGRPMLAEALLIYASEQFPESEVSDSAELSLRVLKKKPIFRTAQKHWGLLKKVVRESQRGDERSEPSRLQALLDSIPASERCLETLEAIDVLERALYAKGPSALAEAWNSIEVRVEP